MRLRDLRILSLLLTSCALGFSQNSTGLTGNWQLTAKSKYFGGTNFSATLAITQNGSDISGTITYQGNPCVGSPTASFVGSVDPFVSVDIRGKLYTIAFSGGVLSGAGQITGGTYTSKYATPGINWAACNPLDPGDAGTWTATESPATAPTSPPPPTINPNGIVSGASFETGVAPNSWITIFGSNLAQKSDSWATAVVNGDLPTVLDGVRVTLGGQAAYIAYVSPTQVNALAPNVETGNLAVVVSNSAGTSPVASAISQAVRPAFFTWGTYAVATHVDFTPAAKNGSLLGLATVPARPGETIILWGTGFGSTNPVAPVGVEVPFGTIYHTSAPVAVTIGGIHATVYGAALSPGYAGLYQVAVEVPSSLTTGDYPVTAAISGVQSPSGTFLTVQ